MAKRSRFQAPRVLSDFMAVVRSLREVQESLDSISQSRAELRKNLQSFNLVAGGFQRASAPAAGMQARLPKASGENLGDAVVLHLEGMLGVLDVFAAPGDTVNGAASIRFDTDGVVVLWSNGVDAWSGVAQTPVGGAGTPTWAQVLTSGNTSGASNPSIDSGQRLIFAGTGASPAGGDIDAAGDLTLDSVGDMHLHAGGALHLGHSGLTDLVHVEGDTEIDIVSGGNLSESAATSIAHQAGTTWTATAAAGDAQVSASASVRLVTGGVERLEILTGGAWELVGATGATNQFIRGQGALASPIWSQVVIADLGNIAANTFLGNVAGVSGPVTANSLATLAGAGLTYAAGVMAVGAGTRITVNANDVQLASGAADSFLMNATAAPGVADYRAGTSVAGAGLTYTTGGTLSIVAADTTITVNADNLQVNQASNFSWTGQHDFNSVVSGTGIYSDTAVAGDLTDVAIGAVNMARFVTTGAAPPYRLNSMVATVDGQWVWVENADSVDSLRIAHEHAASTAANRFVLSNGCDMILPPRTGCWARYDTTSVRWYINAHGGGNPHTITTNAPTGNLGTVDISLLTCGGTWTYTNAASGWSIEGFTAKPVGFWFHFYWDEAVGDQLTLFNEDATATAANRLRMPRGADLRSFAPVSGIFIYGADLRWHWIGDDTHTIGINSLNYISFANSTLDIVTSATAINITAGSTADINVSAGDDIALRADGTQVGVQATKLQVSGESGGTAGGFVSIDEASTSFIAIGAGRGAYWVENTAPTRPMFTDDVEEDWPLGFACPSLPKTANSAASDATTNLSCCTFTHSAGTLRVGSTFLYTGWYVFTHAAANVPTLTAELLINGAVVSACILTPQTLAATFTGIVQAIFTVRSIGAAGTVMIQMLNWGPAQVQASTVSGGSNDTATDAIDTTVNRSSELRIRMTTNPAGADTLTVTHGYVQRLI